MKKSRDEILYNQIRNYCNSPWVSTRVKLPEYGVPVLIAYHVVKNSGHATLAGFDGMAVSLGARYKFREEKISVPDEDGKIVTKTKYFTHLSADGMFYDDLRAMSQAYNIGMFGSMNNYSYQDEYNARGMAKFGIKDPYLKSKEKNKEYDYWVNYSVGKYGGFFDNKHAADKSFIPESTVKKLLDVQNHTRGGFRYEPIQLSMESIVTKSPDFWMPIPAIR